MRVWIINLVLLFSGIPLNGLAEQLKFKRIENPNNIQYQYQWLDGNDEVQSFSFSVNRKLSNDQFRHFKSLSPTRMTKHVKKSLLKTVNTLDRRKGSVKLVPELNGFSFQLTSRDKDWLASTEEKLNTSSKQAVEAFLKREYYIEFAGFGHSANNKTIGYKPDHKRFVEESTEAVEPIANAIVERFANATVRTTASFLLSWIQSIPYDKIESRVSSNGAGFLPPLRLIDANKGDCDSKVVLMASILKQLYPNMRTTIVYVPQHALLGMNISHISDDYLLTIDGLDYTLIEPVGPAQLEFATIAEQSQRYVESNYYITEALY